MLRRPRLLLDSAPTLAIGWLLLLGLQACEPGSPTDPVEGELLSARGTGGGKTTGITISALDPDTVPADTALTIRVLGSGFTAGSQVSWNLAGTPTTKVATTGPVAFISSKELRVPVTIQTDAPLTSYDVVVTAVGGKKGIGVEMLEVVAKFEPLPEPEWAVNSRAEAINEDGVVVGSASDGYGLRALKWTPDGQGWVVEELGSGRAIAVNDDGYVSIWDFDSVAGAMRARIVAPSGTEVDFGFVRVDAIGSSGNLAGGSTSGAPSLPLAWRRLSATAWDEPVVLAGTAGHPNAQVMRMSDEDVIAGFVYAGTWSSENRRPVTWIFDGDGWSDPVLVDSEVGGVARAVNSNGAIAGYILPCASGCPSRPTYWPAAGAARQLLADPYYGRLQGGAVSAVVVDMNNAEQIAGTAVVEIGRSRKVLVDHAAVWLSPSADEYLDLGLARANGYSRASALNDAGVVVGYYQDGGSRNHAVVWRLP